MSALKERGQDKISEVIRDLRGYKDQLGSLVKGGKGKGFRFPTRLIKEYKNHENERPNMVFRDYRLKCEVALIDEEKAQLLEKATKLSGVVNFASRGRVAELLEPEN